jgi:hypothetical protein
LEKSMSTNMAPTYEFNLASSKKRTRLTDVNTHKGLPTSTSAEGLTDSSHSVGFTANKDNMGHVAAIYTGEHSRESTEDGIDSTAKHAGNRKQ